MNILADTQILVWSMDISSPLSIKHRQLLQDRKNVVFISYVSLMELEIKKAIGKLPDFVPEIYLVAEKWIENGFKILPLSEKHIFSYRSVPLFKEHKDPFDRFIIATAIAENFVVMTADDKFNFYEALIELV